MRVTEAKVNEELRRFNQLLPDKQSAPGQFSSEWYSFPVTWSADARNGVLQAAVTGANNNWRREEGVVMVVSLSTNRQNLSVRDDSS